jgi:hypothetical protein
MIETPIDCEYCKRESQSWINRLEAELAAMTARAELAERQVKILAGWVRQRQTCPPPEASVRACTLSGNCVDCMITWSSSEAVKEGGKG